MKKGYVILLVLGVLLTTALGCAGQDVIVDNPAAIVENRQSISQSANHPEENHVIDNSTGITMNKQLTPIPIASISENANYEIVRQTYSEGDTKINYPQVTKMSDSEKQELINQIIKSDALKLVSIFSHRNYKITIDIDSEIALQSAGLLSIKYSGSWAPLGAAHDTQEFFTTNINMYEGNRLILKDLVKIDEDFVEKVKKEQLIAKSFSHSLKDVYFANNRLISAFNTADMAVRDNSINTYNAYSYFTKDSLGISVEVPHVYGGHVEMEVKYQDIAENIKVENGVWKSIFK